MMIQDIGPQNRSGSNVFRTGVVEVVAVKDEPWNFVSVIYLSLPCFRLCFGGVVSRAKEKNVGVRVQLVPNLFFFKLH